MDTVVTRDEVAVPAIESLRLSEERFRLIVESVKDYAIFMLDPRGFVISWNIGVERITSGANRCRSCGAAARLVGYDGA